MNYMRYLAAFLLILLIGCTQQPRMQGRWETSADHSNKLSSVIILQDLSIFGLHEEGFGKLLAESLRTKLEAYNVEIITSTEQVKIIMQAGQDNSQFSEIRILKVAFIKGTKIKKEDLSFLPKRSEYGINEATFLVTLEDLDHKRHFSARLKANPYSPGLDYVWVDSRTTDSIAENIVNALFKKAGFRVEAPN